MWIIVCTKYNSPWNSEFSQLLFSYILKVTCLSVWVFLTELSVRVQILSWSAFRQTNKQKQKQKTLGDRLPDILCLLFIYLFCDVCENALQTDLEDCITSLTYFMSLVSFYTPWKHKKTSHVQLAHSAHS